MLFWLSILALKTAASSAQAEAIQHKVFRHLIREAASTEWGREYDYEHIKSYQDF